MIRINSFIIIAFLVFSCNTNDSQKTNSNKDNELKKDTVKKDIPEYYLSQNKVLYRKGTRKLLGLDSLENGFNGRQIRIWVDDAIHLSDPFQMIVITDSMGLSTGKLYKYYPLHRDQDSLSSRLLSNAPIEPKSGWKTLWNKLDELGVASLPDYSGIPKYFVGSGGGGVLVEYSTFNKYRLYGYPNYDLHIETIPQANRFYEIMLLLQNEFNIKIIFFNQEISN